MTTQINFDRKMLEGIGYKINERRINDPDIQIFIEKSKDFRLASFGHSLLEVAYFGAEHNTNPKLPNITVLPVYSPLASTFGHPHTQAQKGDKRRIQEIYEFLGYGAMLIRNQEETVLHILKPKEKIIVKPNDNMTIFNLQPEPLVTLDYANPNMNSANKDLEKRIGPLMMIECEEFGEDIATCFKINPKYIDEKIIKCEEKIKETGFNYGRILIENPNKEWFISIVNSELGKSLYESLESKQPSKEDIEIYDSLKKRGLGFSAAYFAEKFIQYNRVFEKIGIKISANENIPTDLKEEFKPSLLELVIKQNKKLLGELEII
jgi:hypothetical protein